MKKIFLDTNVLLDVLLERDPFCRPAQLVWSLAETKKIKAAISAVSLSHIFFIVKKQSSGEKGYKTLDALVKTFNVVEVGPRMIHRALTARFADFEDAIQYYSALKFRAQAIITRDPSGFVESQIPVMDSVQYLATRTQ